MSERIMYCCSECADNNPEGCGYFDRSNLRVMRDGRWLCDGCFDNEPLEDLPGTWGDHQEPPEYVAVSQAHGKADL